MIIDTNRMKSRLSRGAFSDINRRRRLAEGISTFGLCLLCAALVAPFVSPENESGILSSVFKWIYSCGAVIYTGARMINVNAPSDSLRLRRLRRMEIWAGIAFCVAAFFWFYNSAKFPGLGFSLGIMNDTILFTLVGASIQIIASWMIAMRMKKESKEITDSPK